MAIKEKLMMNLGLLPDSPSYNGPEDHMPLTDEAEIQASRNRTERLQKGLGRAANEWGYVSPKASRELHHDDEIRQ